ncbi:restriction endonuclease subunit S, partial [uncultured Anaerovibrio sp.]|uniref:restriction endonuclease subunit S n=1 Tax=uncultured Anaerovibrio sp. TaxID=361586 RepID=UPI0025E79557
EIDCLDTLIKARFVEMFGDPVSNPMNWECTRLADKCDIVTGNTPSRKVEEYYGNAIEWIKSDNITEDMFLTTAVEFLSSDGEKVGRTVEAGSILMTCIAGSLRSIGNVAVANRKVAFNQQINAIVPNDQNTYFMYEQFKLTKEHICSGVNMSLKGILSKGQLSDIDFIFPPMELQIQFADFVHQVNKSKFIRPCI